MSKNRRRPKGTKKSWPALLVASQGTVTEPAYLRQLKNHFRASAIDFWQNAKDPVKLVRDVEEKVRREKYSKAFVLVDRDDSPSAQISQAIAICKKIPSVDLILSNECFEVWLLGHYQRVDPVWGRAQLAQKLVEVNAVQPQNPKQIEPDFPIANHGEAVTNVKNVGANVFGSSGSTSMQVVVNEFQRRSQHRR